VTVASTATDDEQLINSHWLCSDYSTLGYSRVRDMLTDGWRRLYNGLSPFDDVQLQTLTRCLVAVWQ
jgi:hypothetical protein